MPANTEVDLVSGDGLLSRLGRHALYASGVAKLAAWRSPSAGVIIRISRVCPSRKSGFQPLRSAEISPELLDRLLTRLPRWGYDIVSMDEVAGRLSQRRRGRRFAALTFDGTYRDVVTHAWPVLIRHRLPFTVYVATGFPDGIADAWWLALEQVIATQIRVGLVVDGREQMFSCDNDEQKQQLFVFLDGWMRKLSPTDLAAAIRDLCSRYPVDMSALAREHCISWDDIRKLASDPFVTIGSATVGHHALSGLMAAQATREMKMGREVLDAALGRPSRHLAYPFGDTTARLVNVASELGFATAVTSDPRLVYPADAAHLLGLPRISWDGRRHTIATFCVALSGIGTSKKS